ncbi:MAG: hypothetical protein U5K76_01820 [Woeseiaceae bacterium]|nr:hypothetical protein [Woeseiaceae bacterium]
MIRLTLLSFALFLAPSLAVNAQEKDFQDELLDKFTGRWVLTGTIAGDDVVHSIDARRALGAPGTLDSSTSVLRKGKLTTKRRMIIGWDEPSDRYVCLWLDSTGGSGLSNGILGYAEKSEDELAFVFAGDTRRFHTTFSYDQPNDIWYWTMDSEKKEGQFKPFARLTMSRR